VLQGPPYRLGRRDNCRGGECDNRREGSGLAIRVSEAQTFWLEFLRKLKRRSRAGVKLMVSDAGYQAVVARSFRATWQRCLVAL
jgi:putative transposase